jgi:uncharacterized membrane protein
MNKNRLEAFSDGVIAIIITIMVLEMKTPEGTDLPSLLKVTPVFISYVLSFIYVEIYWNNHHHMIHTVKKVTGDILLANLYLLFWLSLFPFTTGWLGQNYSAPIPVAAYGFVMLMAAIAYFILQGRILKVHGKDSVLGKAVGNDLKGKLSLAAYSIAIILSFYNTWIAELLYLAVAIMWLIPDKRIEKTLADLEHNV